MWPAIKAFFLDETAFKGYARAVLYGLGGAVLLPPDQVPLISPIMDKLPDYFGVVALMAGGMVRAGDKNKQ